MSENLVHLAERFLRLTSELEDTRRSMLSALANGGGDPPKAPFAQPVRSKSGGRSPSAKPTSSHPNALAAKEAEAQIVALLKDRPGLRTAEIAKATEAKRNTVVQRLQRMRERGLIARENAGGWASV